MVEQAIVSRVEASKASIVLCPTDHCSSCHTCGLLGGRTPRVIDALNSAGLQIKAGDIVEVYTSPSRAVGAAFQVLILPLLLFLAGYSGSGALGITSEPVRVLAGAGGLALGFLTASLGGKNEDNLPRIVSVVAEAPAHPLAER
jgi:positive regulator of sigma E activity